MHTNSHNTPSPANTPYLLWRGVAIGLLDLDAFFASVEVLDHPEWAGKPLIVGGSAERRGVVSTASYEARKYGVHSAMPAAQAKKLCPQAIWVQGNYARYSEMSDKVMALIKDETPFVEQVSIDEAFFDVSPGQYAHEDPVKICQRIQERVFNLGVSCSIGLATTKSIAKIASEREKPRGLTVVFPGSEASFMQDLPVRALSGIGPAAEKRLKEYGILTLGQLANCSAELAQNILGKTGLVMRERARGEELSPVLSAEDAEDIKSVSNERTFAQDLTDKKEVYAAVDHVASLVARRLRKKKLAGKTITLKLRFEFVDTHTSQLQLDHHSCDEAEISRVARQLLQKLWDGHKGIRLIGVAVSGFDEEPEQMNLFADEEKSNLLDTADAIRARFGKAALSYGRDLRFEEQTSDTQPTGRKLD